MMNSHWLGCGAAVFVVAAGFLACSSDEPQTPAGTSTSSGSSGSTTSSSGSTTSSSGSTTSSSGSSGSTSSSGSSGSTVGGCTTFVDRSAATADRTIAWDTNLPNVAARCMTIAVGQKVTLVTPGSTTPGDFVNHPVAANGGATPNPATSLNKATGEMTFPTAGTFGFKCDIHGFMVGAIQVK